MCEPTTLSIISMLATAAGTAATVKSGRDQSKARNAAALNEVMNKKKVDEQSQDLFRQAVAESDPAAAARDADKAAAEEVAATQDQLAKSRLGFRAGPSNDSTPSESPVVKESAARSLADALQVADSQVKARATLRGLGMQRQQRFNQLTRNNQQQAMLRNFMQGWGQVGQVGQAAAEHAGEGAALLGDTLTGLGSIGMAAAGGMKGGAPVGEGGQLVKPITNVPQSSVGISPALFRSYLGPTATGGP